jgi:hypothetical protein
LADQESKILEDALKNVRLTFVETSGGTPASMMPKSAVGEFPMDDDYDQDAGESEEIGSAAADAPPSPVAPATVSTPAPAESESKKKFTKSYG